MYSERILRISPNKAKPMPPKFTTCSGYSIPERSKLVLGFIATFRSTSPAASRCYLDGNHREAARVWHGHYKVIMGATGSSRGPQRVDHQPEVAVWMCAAL